MPIGKLLIANRGEIALRILRTCRELGIATVAVHSTVDRNALHVQLADEAVCVGEAPSSKSYLNIPNILAAATSRGADAIHPGYGFLAENDRFAEICKDHGITFVGPSPEAIRAMGDKSTARSTMQQVGVPTIPGSEGLLENAAEAAVLAQRMGYPVMIKATAGGGGRGMRIVRTPSEMARAYRTASREAEAAFGVPDVYVEKYLENPRHIEFQILGDHAGNIVHLGERECSIQRRHQKLVEESPSPALTDKIRRKMGAIVVDAARRVQYTNAGTFEFLMDGEGKFYFMEVNTRLQVEHGVTELVTNIDIVKEQIRVAAGERLSFRQSDIVFTGHAIECRVNAECPDTFIPSPGTIRTFSIPGGPGIRVDTAMYAEATVTPYYDSMIAKLMAYGRDREEAIARMRRALDMTVVEGIKTSIPLHRRILASPDFVAGRLDTGFMERFLATPKPEGLAEAV